MTWGGVCDQLTDGLDDEHMRGGWVYIMANRPFGTLYIGVTNDLARRAWEHRIGAGSGFTKRYRLGMLVYSEWHEEIARAIQRETSLKRWPRQWKLNLIETQNPEWRDLFESLLAQLHRQIPAPDLRLFRTEPLG